MRQIGFFFLYLLIAAFAQNMALPHHIIQRPGPQLVR